MTDPTRSSPGVAVIVLAACLWGLFVQAPPAQTQKPRTDPLCTLESARYRVDFLRGGYCCPNELEFWVEDRRTGVDGPLAVATQVTKAEHMKIVAGSKLLVTGLLERGAMALAVVDLAEGSLQDEIHTFDYRLSPSQSLVVFSRHYGDKDAPPDERRPLLLLYDLAGSAADNRAGEAATFDSSNAGLPVYPEANARQGSYDPRLEPPHRYLSALLWSADETRIVFFEAFDGKYWLVAIDLSAGREPPRIARKEISIAELAPGAADGERLPVVNIGWKDDATVELQALVDGVLRDAVAIAVPVP